MYDEEELAFQNATQHLLANGTNGFSPNILSGLSDLGKWVVNPLGIGKNAMSPLQIGLTGYALYNQNKNNQEQLKLAREQMALDKANMQSNFLNSGTNWMNQNLFQTQGLSAFNQNAGALRAEDIQSGLNQLNQAGSLIGLGDNAFASQAEALKKYNSLKV